MAGQDEWDDRRGFGRRPDDDERERLYGARRREEEGYLDYGYSEPPYRQPRLSRGPGLMNTQTGSGTGNPATTGRYYEDFETRANYGGYAGGAASVAPSSAPGYAPAHPADPQADRRAVYGEFPPGRGYRGGSLAGPRYASYRDYAREHGGYGAGGGYAPTHEDAVGEQRSWIDRTSDEVSSWFGDRDAERRRQMDAARQGEHRGKGPKGYKRPDSRIHEDVADRLTDDPMLDARDIEVSVSEGEVTLNGTVASRGGKRRAEDLVDSVSGVTHVQNNLRVAEAQPYAGQNRTQSGSNADAQIASAGGAAPNPGGAAR